MPSGTSIPAAIDAATGTVAVVDHPPGVGVLAADYSVLAAANGAEALTLIRAVHSRRPGLPALLRKPATLGQVSERRNTMLAEAETQGQAENRSNDKGRPASAQDLQARAIRNSPTRPGNDRSGAHA